MSAFMKHKTAFAQVHIQVQPQPDPINRRCPYKTYTPGILSRKAITKLGDKKRRKKAACQCSPAQGLSCLYHWAGNEIGEAHRRGSSARLVNSDVATALGLVERLEGLVYLASLSPSHSHALSPCQPERTPKGLLVTRWTVEKGNFPFSKPVSPVDDWLASLSPM